MKKYFFTFLFLTLALPMVANAEYLIIEPSKTSTFSKNEEFYLDIKLDPNNISINGIEGLIIVPSGIEVLSVEDGNSLVKNWIEKPIVSNNIKFSGIIPNGFSGYLNTYDQKKGFLFRLVLKGKESNKYDLKIKEINLTKNDGQGTLIKNKDISFSLNIDETVSDVKYFSDDNTRPFLDYEIISDANIFDGKKVLIFNAIDDKSGVKEVLIKEGRKGDFVKIESPYLLEDQLRKGIITLRVLDNNNNETIIKIKPPVFGNLLDILLVIIFVLIVIIFYAKYKNKKNINNI